VVPVVGDSDLASVSAASRAGASNTGCNQNGTVAGKPLLPSRA
jgi:hypothetical protein